MTGFWSFVLYLVGVAIAIWCIADAARNFTEKKWGWFGFSAYLTIYWMAWIIHHSFWVSEEKFRKDNNYGE